MNECHSNLTKERIVCNSHYTMSKRSKTTLTITRSLKKAIKDSGMNFKALERETGVKRQSLMKFMRDEQSLRLDFADRLAEFFELELRERKEK